MVGTRDGDKIGRAGASGVYEPITDHVVLTGVLMGSLTFVVPCFLRLSGGV